MIPDFDEFRWRDTYFVFFEASHRPPLERVRHALSRLSQHFELSHPSEDEEGSIESITLYSPDDYAALEISFESGEEVRRQVTAMVKDLKGSLTGESEDEKLAILKRCDARLDVMHFEQIVAESEGEIDEMFDPASLLMVLECLCNLTKGVAVDPQSGALI